MAETKSIELVNQKAQGAMLAYSIFRGSYRATEVPHWNDLPVWIRDVLIFVHSDATANYPELIDATKALITYCEDHGWGEIPEPGVTLDRVLSVISSMDGRNV